MAEPDATPPLSLLDGAALFLDFDGTLVELAESPDAIRVPEDLQPLLRRLAERLGGRLAIVSGRSIEDLERHLDCLGFAVSGSHGLELRLRDGTHIPLSAPRQVPEAAAKAESFARDRRGLLVEQKPYGVALHYRGAPAEREAVSAFMGELSAATGLSLQHGNMVAELRPRGADKGDAVRALMAEPDFAGAVPVVVGDDLTDEDAFRAAAELGGGGILVGPARDSAAAWRLPDVAAVAGWLSQAAEAR